MVPLQPPKNSKPVTPVKPARAVRQPTAPALEGQKTDAPKKIPRGLVPARPPSVAPPTTPLVGVPEDFESDPKASISRAISRGRSGVVDVQGLLSRQPSVHPPNRARTPSGKVEQLQQHKESSSWPVSMSPFAATTPAEASAGHLTHGRDLNALPPLAASSAGKAGTAGTAALSVSTLAATGSDAQHRSHARRPSSLQGPVSRAADGHYRLTGQADSASSAQHMLADADGLSANQAGAAGDQSSKPVPTLRNMAGDSQNSSTYSRRPRHHGPSPTLQLSLLDTSHGDDGGEAQQVKPSAALTAQSPELRPRRSNSSSMADLSPGPIDNSSSIPTLPTAMGAEHVSNLHSRGLPDVLESVRSRQGSALSSSTSRTKSVTFGGAHTLGLQPGSLRNTFRSSQLEEQSEALRSSQGLTQQLRAYGKEGLGSIGSSSSGSGLVRLSSSLSAAVTETMQDRMLAGGMMHRQAENTHADRCPWLRNTAKFSSATMDELSGRRSSLKHTTNEVSGSLGTSGYSDVASGNASAAGGGQGRRSMPPQLARHQSSLNQVSKRPDFAAAMLAVRTSWRAEQIGQLETESSLVKITSDNVHERTAAEDEQSSLDAVWASIRHQQ